MINNVCLLALGVLLSLSTISCTDEMVYGSTLTEGTALVHLDITIPNAEIVQSRAGGTLSDTSLEQLDLLLFDNTGDVSADESRIKLIAHRKVNTTALSANLPLSPDKRLIFLVANAEQLLADVSEVDEELLNADGVTYKYSLADIRAKLVTKAPTLDSQSFTKDIPQLPILMSGMWSGDKLNAAIKIPVSLTRVFSKITAETSLPAGSFKILKISVCNAATQADVLKPKDILTDGEAYGRMSYKSENNQLYTYPTNLNDSVGKSVSVIVEAQFMNRPSSFYRLLIRDENKNPLSLKRNYHYKIKIKRVDIEGADSFESALNGPDMNIGYDVTSSNDFNNSILLGGYSFSTDYDRIVVYADSLESVLLSTLVTDYPFPDGIDVGSITVDEGLILEGRNTFAKGDSIRSFSVKLTSAYSNPIGSATKKGLHISLGLFRRTVEVFKEPSVDLHPSSLLLENISTARVLSSGGSDSWEWIKFSLSPIYSIYRMRTYLDEVSLSATGYKGYVYMDENISPSYREALIETFSTSGVGTKHIMHQEGYDKYSLGYFGNALSSSSNSSMYSKPLIIEAYEEENNLSWLPIGTTLTTEDATELEVENGIHATYLLATKYKSPAALYCLNKNRDTNGNGVIDESEVLWYLPTRGQGIGISFYQSLVDNVGKAYWSSTYKTGSGVWTLLTYLNDNEYSNQATVTGYQLTPVPYDDVAKYGKPRNVRCVRDK